MGFYRGLATPLIGSMAEISTLMTSYGFFKRLLGETPGGPELPPWKLMLASGGAGIGVTCVLTPVELIKCKLQVQNTPGYNGVAYKGPLDVIYKMCMQAMGQVSHGHPALDQDSSLNIEHEYYKQIQTIETLKAKLGRMEEEEEQRSSDIDLLRSHLHVMNQQLEKFRERLPNYDASAGLKVPPPLPQRLQGPGPQVVSIMGESQGLR